MFCLFVFVCYLLSLAVFTVLVQPYGYDTSINLLTYLRVTQARNNIDVQWCTKEGNGLNTPLVRKGELQVPREAA